MAENDRLTNKERRALAREERKRQEAEAAKKRKKNQLRNGLVTFVIVGVVAAVLLQAFLGGPESIDDTILISTSDADDAREAAGCEVLADRSPLPERFHFEGAPPPADTVYTDVRPTHSGPHAPGVHPITAAANRQIDEVVSTHNLEHGSLIVWYDPDAVNGSEVGTWAETLNANGFRRDQSGVGILTAPYTDPGMSSGKAVAFRGWGTAMDCDEWDETVAHSFVIENFGTRGIAPERMAAPYPEEILAYEDRDLDDTTTEEAPVDTGTPPPDVVEVDPDLEEPADGDEPTDDGEADDEDES